MLRSMWEFAATWRLLRLLSRPLSFTMPTPRVLEAALEHPTNDLTTLALVHGRGLGISAASSGAKWMGALARFARKRSDEFGRICGGDLSVLNDLQAYENFGPEGRLRVLWTLVEIICADNEGVGGTVAELDVDDLRLDPIGVDAGGNVYWYFGDEDRLYREPGGNGRQAKVDKEEQKERKAEEARLAKEEKAEQRKLKEAAKKEKEHARQTRKRKSMEKWAPRVAARRSTRASRAAAAALSVPPLDETQDDACDKMVIDGDDDGHDEEPGESDDSGGEYINSGRTPKSSRRQTPERRTSGRRRKAPVQLTADRSVEEFTPKKRRRNEQVYADPTLRNCREWELVCEGADNLRSFIARFGPRRDLSHSSERALLRRLEEELLPIIEEAELKMRRELEKRERAAFLVNNQKRSSRVQALELKREAEAAATAAALAAEKEREQQAAALAAETKAMLERLEREQSRELRSVRRLQNKSDAGIDSKMYELPYDSRKIVARHVATRRSARSSRQIASPADVASGIVAMDGPTPNVKDGELSADKRAKSEVGSTEAVMANGTLVKTPSKTGVKQLTVEGAQDVHMEEAPTPANTPLELTTFGVVSKDAAVEKMHTSTREGAVASIIPEAVHTSSASGPESAQQTLGGKHQRLTSGTLEADIPDSMNWMMGADDGIPTRALDRFFFVSGEDYVEAPIEACDESPLGLSGCGILIPPPTQTSLRPIRVELGNTFEWVIEYGNEPRLWVRTEHAWYELLRPAVEYRSTFASARQKYEICIRLSILGDTMKAPELSYGVVVDLLSMRYNDMLAYKENQILDDLQFIVTQMELLDNRSLMHSGFVRALQKKLRAIEKQVLKEEGKVAPVRRKTVTSSQTVARKSSTKTATNGSNAEFDSSSTQSKARKIPRKRSTSKGPPVPRAVSSILNSIIRAATKPNTPSRRPRKKPIHKEKPAAAVSLVSLAPRLATAGHSALPVAAGKAAVSRAEVRNDGSAKKGRVWLDKPKLSSLLSKRKQAPVVVREVINAMVKTATGSKLKDAVTLAPAPMVAIQTHATPKGSPQVSRGVSALSFRQNGANIHSLETSGTLRNGFANGSPPDSHLVVEAQLRIPSGLENGSKEPDHASKTGEGVNGFLEANGSIANGEKNAQEETRN